MTKGNNTPSELRPEVEDLTPTLEMIAHRELLQQVLRGEKPASELEAAVAHLPGAVDFLRSRKVLK